MAKIKHKRTSPVFFVKEFILDYLQKPENKHNGEWTHLMTLKCAAFQVISDVDACRMREYERNRNIKKSTAPRPSNDTIEEKITKGKNRIVGLALNSIYFAYSEDKKYIRLIKEKKQVKFNLKKNLCKFLEENRHEVFEEDVLFNLFCDRIEVAFKYLSSEESRIKRARAIFNKCIKKQKAVGNLLFKDGVVQFLNNVSDKEFVFKKKLEKELIANSLEEPGTLPVEFSLRPNENHKGVGTLRIGKIKLLFHPKRGYEGKPWLARMNMPTQPREKRFYTLDEAIDFIVQIQDGSVGEFGLQKIEKYKILATNK